eukprot:gnl/TRDRNA2_/TRDRNA2_134787_c0_seq3.p1 gnl/TRDRNA2_/TRDRNA2_134787_c0~~gnl/TRDRNA2_/TRDRNA2_134787_c0_seq3.p1  ORF type:complete len:182 (+),score=36.49 gnl/TRDRNA2_/TRDRNA2_134787_c0_seq3:55-600(+)
MDILRSRPERTVCRLTLLRGINMEQPEAWAVLLSRASPDFIEMKAATLAPIFKNSGLTTMNMPTHREVKQFAESLASLLPDYGLACEHEHSVSVLLASKRFLVNADWRTWIDFEHFADVWDQPGSLEAADYTAPTPEWALYGSEAEGFAPAELRKRRARARPLFSLDKLKKSPGAQANATS